MEFATAKLQFPHTKGNQNPSDFLSRHTSLVESKRAEEMSLHAIPRAMTLAELQEATKADATLQYLIQVIRSGEWSKLQSPQSDDVDRAQLKLFMNVKHGSPWPTYCPTNCVAAENNRDHT